MSRSFSNQAIDSQTPAAKKQVTSSQVSKAMIKGGSTTRIVVLLMQGLINASDALNTADRNFRDICGLNMRTARTINHLKQIANPDDLSSTVNATIQVMGESKSKSALADAFQQRWMGLKPDVDQYKKELDMLRKTAKEVIEEQHRMIKEIARNIETNNPVSDEIQQKIHGLNKAANGLKSQSEKLEINTNSLGSKIKALLQEMGHAPETKATEGRGVQLGSERPQQR